MSERSKDAIAAFERVAKARHADLGAEHADTLVADNNLATAYVVARQYELAAPMFAKTLEVHRRRYGRDHPTTLAIEMNLGSTHLRRGRADLALPVLRRARDGYRKTFANEPLAYAGVLAGMGKELNRARLHAEAEDWLRDCVVVRGKHAPNDWSLGYAQYLLGEAQAAQDKRRDALANLKSARALLEAQSSKVPSRYRDALRNAARLLGDLEKRR